MRNKKLKIAVIAPPWLSLYPGCYYGIEIVVHNLVTSLTELGHTVELFTVGGSTTKAKKLHWYHQQDQYRNIHRPYYESVSIVISHILYSLNKIREAGDFDIIHDHNSLLGPAMLAYASNLPPILHTLHDPFTDLRKLNSGVPDNRHIFAQFKSIKNLYFCTVSNKLRELAPTELQPQIKATVYNGIDVDSYTFNDEKQDYFAIVASMSPDKGQATAARLCKELGVKLKMAGTIGGQISTPEEMREAMANPVTALNTDPYFRYFKEEVAPHLVEGQVEYVGKVSGKQQKDLFANAKAFLFPIDWEETFGMSVIDALASGTPVIAFRRGSMPELIEHGVTGFIADNETQFKEYMGRVDEIDPAACRRSVEEKFSSQSMAANYVSLYRDIIKRYWRQRARHFVNNNLNPRLAYPQTYRNLPKLIPHTEQRHYIHKAPN